MALACYAIAGEAVADDKKNEKTGAEKLPLIHRDDFESGMDHWRPTDDPFWKIVQVDDEANKSKSLRVTGKSKYQPPVRSPHSIAWLKDKNVGDFVLTVKAKNTNFKAGNHRDLCLFWGRQDSSHFYYVHFGAKADPHSCQIFIVDGKPRTKITVNQAKGTPWGEATKWHTLRVVRKVKEGTIEVFFDNMDSPMMTAKDKTFQSGTVGLGTFDDHGNFDDFELRGVELDAEKKNEKE